MFIGWTRHFTYVLASSRCAADVSTHEWCVMFFYHQGIKNADLPSHSTNDTWWSSGWDHGYGLKKGVHLHPGFFSAFSWCQHTWMVCNLFDHQGINYAELPSHSTDDTWWSSGWDNVYWLNKAFHLHPGFFSVCSWCQHTWMVCNVFLSPGN